MDFTNIDICIDCIKWKQKKYANKKRATKGAQLLEIIHTDISGLYNVPSFGGAK